MVRLCFRGKGRPLLYRTSAFLLETQYCVKVEDEKHSHYGGLGKAGSLLSGSLGSFGVGVASSE